MTCEYQNGRSRSDTMPFPEARRETTEVDISVPIGRFLGVADSEGNFASVRVKGARKLFARECHGGKESVWGNVRLSEGESYDVDLESGVARIIAGEATGMTRVFKVLAPEGTVVQTGK